MTTDSPATPRLIRRPLAACLGMLLALASNAEATSRPGLMPSGPGIEPLLDRLRARAEAARLQPHAPARPTGGAVLPVTSCADDGGSGTLRRVVLTASSGDTVDLSALTCSTITLVSGAVNVDIDDLTILGPGANKLAIDANENGRVFHHGGTGTLYIQDITLTRGSYTLLTGPYGGGCIYSKGSVSLEGAVVSSCTGAGADVLAGGAILVLENFSMFHSTIKDSTVTTQGAAGNGAIGGAVFAVGEVSVEFSTISNNVASTGVGDVYAGGLFSGGGLTAKYSTVTGNSVTTMNAPGSGYYGIGGGMFVQQGAFIQNSTIDNNSADGGAGINTHYYNASTLNTVLNSTITGNRAAVLGGGMIVGANLRLENSTIAFNYSGSRGGGGLLIEGNTAQLYSSIIADNSPSGAQAAADLDGGATITGSNNIIKIAGAALTLPPDTIATDPQLGNLAYNGGPTRTMSIPATSPAFDAGNNVSGALYDQRGPSFPRVVGAAADIGAYELNPDIIFIAGFDGS